MMTANRIKRASLVLLALLLAACGEYKQAVAYENGGYQGKKDERVWDNDRSLHDPAMWKQMIHDRNQRQNEFDRSGD